MQNSGLRLPLSKEEREEDWHEAPMGFRGKIIFLNLVAETQCLFFGCPLYLIHIIDILM